MRHNEGPMRRLRTAICTLLAVLASATLDAQAIDSGSIFRIFLKDGAALPSYGDYAVVGDRLVFALAIGQDSSQVQVMSLPAASVDLDRTARYARSVRAAHYARTRGEADYAAITDEVTRALDHLTRVEDPLKRLALAEEAKRRLLQWSGENYSYRAPDIRELARLFDEVIAELRVAAGQSTFSLEFSTGPLVPDLEPLWPAPAFSESLNVALAAAHAADMPEERVGVLRAALAAIPDDEANSQARAILGREIEAELDADAAYARLSASLLARAERSMQQGDVRGVSAVEAELTVRDDALGQRRRGFVASLAAQLRAMVERTGPAVAVRAARAAGADGAGRRGGGAGADPRYEWRVVPAPRRRGEDFQSAADDARPGCSPRRSGRRACDAGQRAAHGRTGLRQAPRGGGDDQPGRGARSVVGGQRRPPPVRAGPWRPRQTAVPAAGRRGTLNGHAAPDPRSRRDARGVQGDSGRGRAARRSARGSAPRHHRAAARVGRTAAAVD
jgi:hypothetical protein